MSTRLPFTLSAALAATLALSVASAHHGWSSYDEKTVLNLTGTIVESTYGNPHSTIRLKTADNKTWFAWLAPVSRMEQRGMNKDMVKMGATVTVVGYPSTEKQGELRVERITVDGKTTELR